MPDTSTIELRPGQLDHPQVVALLRHHFADMAAQSPPESTHALDLDELRTSRIDFWGAWRGDMLLGCAALKTLDVSHVEIKSMRTAPAHLRQGVAALLLRHLLERARANGYRRISLETGSMAEFGPARALYARFGFTPCAAFDDYNEDPNSVFMTKTL